MIKKVVTSYYVHKSNLDELLTYLSAEDTKWIKEIIECNKSTFNDCDIVKYNYATKRLSLINTIGWDTLYEPIVGDSYCFQDPYSFKLIRGGTKVYHHKWQFVDSNYSGFDIEVSKERSKLWEKIVSSASISKTKIGNKVFWYGFLEKFNLGR